MRSAICPVTTVAVAAFAVALSAAPALASATVPPEGSRAPEGLTVVETLGLFVLAPLAVFAIIALAVLGPSMGKGARNRRDSALESGPVWVGADGQSHMDQPVLGDPGDGSPTERHHGAGSTAVDPGPRGGASGRW